MFEYPVMHTLINAEVLLPYGDEMKLATIKQRTTNINGDQVGTYDKQPFINTIMYNAEFRDGVIRNYGVNIIAQNLYS